MDSTIELRNRNWAVAGTLGLHVLLILLLLFYTLVIPDPLPSDIPMELELGTGFLEAGGGGGGGSTSSASPDKESSSSEEISAPSNMTSDAVEENPVTETPTPPSVKPVNTTKPQNTKPQHQSNPNATFTPDMNDNSGGTNGTNGTGNNGSNGSGNNGNGGTGNNGNNGPGTFGNGYGDGVPGRTLKFKPTITDDIHEEGRVVVNIVVDQQGNVSRATINEQHTNTASKHLRDLAIAGARKVTWNAQSDAPVGQKGMVVFNFTMK